jgi:SAM-dependent methyltransferase
MTGRGHAHGGRVLSWGAEGTGWGLHLTFSVKRMPPSEGGLPKKHKTFRPHPVPSLTRERNPEEEGPADRRAGPVVDGGSPSSQAAGGDPPTTPPARDAEVIWHEVECGGYEADLELWEELADEAIGPVLELGCGTGRVALHLSRRGHSVSGVDSDPALASAFNQRVGGLPTAAELADARSFELKQQFALILAPMQLVQLLADASERIACLSRVRAHLRSDGIAAFAIVEEMPEAVDASPPLPDAREEAGWVYSSLPLDAAVLEGKIVVRRLRQIVSPDGELSDEVDEVRLQTLTASVLEHEAEEAGLRPAGRRAIAATDAHVGSTVVLLERAA